MGYLGCPGIVATGFAMPLVRILTRTPPKGAAPVLEIILLIEQILHHLGVASLLKSVAIYGTRFPPSIVYLESALSQGVMLDATA